MRIIGLPDLVTAYKRANEDGHDRAFEAGPASSAGQEPYRCQLLQVGPAAEAWSNQNDDEIDELLRQKAHSQAGH